MLGSCSQGTRGEGTQEHPQAAWEALGSGEALSWDTGTWQLGRRLRDFPTGAETEIKLNGVIGPGTDMRGP